MAELANCSTCDAVYVKNIRDICQNCYNVEEKSFEIVYHFLLKRKNREATLADIVKATKVEEKLIVKFIREKRLRTSQFPMLAYGCEKCGTNITTGNICMDCTEEMRSELEAYEANKAKQTDRKVAEEEITNVYYSFDKHKNSF